MTKDQLHTAFKIELDKSGNMGYPAFLPEEIDYWLDKALYQVISNKFTGNNTLKQPFEKSVKRIHDLSPLVGTAKDITLIKTQNTNQLRCDDVFKNKLFYVDAVLKWDSQTGKQTANIELIEHSNIGNFAQTYNNTPWIEHPVAVIDNDSLCIYVDPISMKSNEYKMDLTYVGKPTDISILSDTVQYEIVSRAVALALENIESPRVQTKTQLNQIDE